MRRGSTEQCVAMSSSYSANQRPSAVEGHTAFIATDRGHLLPGLKKRAGVWSSFQGTWDLPNRILPSSINPTARSHEGQERLRNWAQNNAGPGTGRRLEPEPRGSSRTSQQEVITEMETVQDQLDEDVPGPLTSPAAQNQSSSQQCHTPERLASQQSHSHLSP
ncbi:protein Flattop isoform X2 [Denticeps clupeoides]|uniref:protein Flattop isoform X2 n=1 Tax=Denticeps clupeoides TaxID=299321 RepID=UPI0010A31123|nr:protein Flattop isoform X2 [Denticeps clupeoides]